MKKQTLQINAVVAIAGLIIVAGSSAYPQETQLPVITAEPQDQLVPVGTDATFSVTTGGECSYQWLRNGVAIDNQTNSALTIENVKIADAGYYSCNVATGSEMLPTSIASLMVYTINPDDFVIAVYALPIVSAGSAPPCPGKYAGYVNYILSVQQGWGWEPSTNTTVYTATDNNQTNTKVEYVGSYGDNGCNQTSVTIPYPAVSPLYRFSIFFTNNVPSTNYPITLSGFVAP